jgi:CheY-like chemotaxis protein
LFRSASQPPDGPVSAEPAAPSLGANELALALVNLLKSGKSDHGSTTRPSWTQRRGLVCTAPAHRETIARGLSSNGYEIFVAEDTQQAVERMRQSQLDVVILDPDFDAVEQGAAFVTRDVNVRRPAERRRLFFVLLSSSKRTMETHSAFLQNVNLAVNFNELVDLPEILDYAMREFNELYKDFNLVLNVAPL